MTLTKNGGDEEKHQPEAGGIYPKSAISWYNKGINLHDLDRNEEALIAYNKAIEINPIDQATWLNKGHVLSSLGKKEEAQVAIDKAIEINPNNGTIWISKGISLGHLGRAEEAYLAFDKAIEIDPKDKFARCVKKKALLNNGKYEWTRKIIKKQH